MGIFRKRKNNTADAAEAAGAAGTANAVSPTVQKAPVNDPRFAAYTGLVEGTIIDHSSPMMNVYVITVQYNVAGTDYTIQDMVRYTEPQLHSFEFPKKRTPLLPSVEIGAKVPVGYMPDNPQLAYIIGNQEAVK